jgi:hypothetical protein
MAQTVDENSSSISLIYLRKWTSCRLLKSVLNALRTGVTKEETAKLPKLLFTPAFNGKKKGSAAKTDHSILEKTIS